jgi:vacuolar-type H+-ATPase subunit H
MGRPAVRRLEPHRSRRRRDGAVMAAMAVVALFALVGVASAAVFIADRASGSSSSPPAKSSSNNGSAVAAQNIARAHAQATAIVAAAQTASQNIVKSATKDARKKSDQIINSAKRKAAQIVSSARVSSSRSTAPTTSSAQTGTATGPTTAPTAAPVNSNYTPLPAGSPNLSGYPASWLVIATGVTFGSGPGDAGGITIVNRGKVPFSGVARVYYVGGGSSRAIFSNIAPGQVAIYPLSGRAYTGRGYTIRLKHLH